MTWAHECRMTAEGLGVFLGEQAAARLCPSAGSGVIGPTILPSTSAASVALASRGTDLGGHVDRPDAVGNTP